VLTPSTASILAIRRSALTPRPLTPRSPARRAAQPTCPQIAKQLLHPDNVAEPLVVLSDRRVHWIHGSLASKNSARLPVRIQRVNVRAWYARPARTAARTGRRVWLDLTRPRRALASGCRKRHARRSGRARRRLRNRKSPAWGDRRRARLLRGKQRGGYLRRACFLSREAARRERGVTFAPPQRIIPASF
jgi:hypothetical protein